MNVFGSLSNQTRNFAKQPSFLLQEGYKQPQSLGYLSRAPGKSALLAPCFNRNNLISRKEHIQTPDSENDSDDVIFYEPMKKVKSDSQSTTFNEMSKNSFQKDEHYAFNSASRLAKDQSEDSDVEIVQVNKTKHKKGKIREKQKKDSLLLQNPEDLTMKDPYLNSQNLIVPQIQYNTVFAVPLCNVPMFYRPPENLIRPQLIDQNQFYKVRNYGVPPNMGYYSNPYVHQSQINAKRSFPFDRYEFRPDLEREVSVNSNQIEAEPIIISDHENEDHSFEGNSSNQMASLGSESRESSSPGNLSPQDLTPISFQIKIDEFNDDDDDDDEEPESDSERQNIRSGNCSDTEVVMEIPKKLEQVGNEKEEVKKKKMNRKKPELESKYWKVGRGLNKLQVLRYQEFGDERELTKKVKSLEPRKQKGKDAKSQNFMPFYFKGPRGSRLQVIRRTPIGNRYQAVLLPFRSKNTRRKPAVLTWNPEAIGEVELESYLTQLAKVAKEKFINQEKAIYLLKVFDMNPKSVLDEVNQNLLSYKEILKVEPRKLKKKVLNG